MKIKKIKDMAIFKKQTPIDNIKLFDNNGDFNLIKEVGDIIDTIFIVLAVQKETDIYKVNLELRRCGFFLNIGELRKVIIKLIKEGLITDGRFNLN